MFAVARPFWKVIILPVIDADLQCFLTLIKMGFLKNDLENFNCLFLKKVSSDDFF